jgi:5-methylcytosine-specific restriction endonuclease McrA
MEHYDADGILYDTEKISKRTERRYKVYLRDGGICQWCQKRLTFDESTIDHKIAKVNGGSNDFDNLLLSCRRCNNQKAAMSPDEFQIKISEIARREIAAQWWTNNRKQN